MTGRTLVLGMLMLGLAAGGARAAEDPVARADAIVRRAMSEQHIPGLQIAVVKNGQIVMSRAYGVSSLATGAPATVQTVFPIHSITKAFTGVAAMREVDAGRLDLSKPIETYVADLPEAWRGIPVHRLLSHSSGLPAFDDSDGDGIAALNAALAAPIRFAPGERFDYNQTNYALVQMAVNGLRDRPRDATLAQEQFTLAGMTQSGFGDSRDIAPERAVPYGYRRATPDQPTVRTEIFSPLHRAASGMNSTAQDMARWLIALQDDKLLSPAARRAMWTPATFNDGRKGQWGMGWLVMDRPGRRLVGMTGGSRSAMYLYPDDNVGVVILSNLAGATPEDLIEEVAQGFIPGMSLTGVAALRAALTGAEADPEPAVARFRAAQPDFTANEHQLNDWGYRLLSFGRPRTALAVMKLTAELYPASANAFDSLGEAYAATGDKAAAIVAYRQSLRLDPANKNAVERLKRLEAPPTNAAAAAN